MIFRSTVCTLMCAYNSCVHTAYNDIRTNFKTLLILHFRFQTAISQKLSRFHFQTFAYEFCYEFNITITGMLSTVYSEKLPNILKKMDVSCLLPVCLICSTLHEDTVITFRHQQIMQLQSSLAHHNTFSTACYFT